MAIVSMTAQKCNYASGRAVRRSERFGGGPAMIAVLGGIFVDIEEAI
jgi:hypothetical protein